MSNMATVTIGSLKSSLLHRTILLLLLLLSCISFTIGDSSDLEVASGTPTTSSLPSSNTDLEYSKKRREQSQSSPSPLSPKKLSLFAKALRKVVQAQCPNVDHPELDTFQAYLTRQILKGDTQTMRHPLQFESLYQSLTGCANFFSPPLARAMMAEHYPDIDESNKRRTYQPTDKVMESLSSSSTTESSTTELKVTLAKIARKPGTSSDLHHARKSESKISPMITHSQPDFKSTKHPKDVETGMAGNPKPRPSTVIDKMIFNVTDITMNFISGLFSSVFGRRKREISSLEREGNPDSGVNDENQTSSYSKSQMVRVRVNTNKTNMASDQPDGDNNYNEIWNSVSAQETKMSAYAHVINLLKSFIVVTVDGCSKTLFPIEETYLTQICGLMANQVMVDLVEAESQGMVVTFNEKLENDLEICAKGISGRTMAE